MNHGTVLEMFTTEYVVINGQITASSTSVDANNAAIVMLGFLPLTLVALSIQDIQRFVVNLVLVALLRTELAVHIQFGLADDGIKRSQVGVLDGIYPLYLLVMVFSILHLFRVEAVVAETDFSIRRRSTICS